LKDRLPGPIERYAMLYMLIAYCQLWSTPTVEHEPVQRDLSDAFGFQFEMKPRLRPFADFLETDTRTRLSKRIDTSPDRDYITVSC